MKLSFDSDNVKVYDDVLIEEDFNNLFDFINNISYSFTHPDGEWNKSWNLSRGRILRSNTLTWKLGCVPTVDYFYEPLIPFVETVNKIIIESDVLDTSRSILVHMTPYCYGPGSGLSWHDDRCYIAALSFYSHKYWSPEWGGEFVTIEANDRVISDRNDIQCGVFDKSKLHSLIMKNSVGNFFYPNPNRVVINKGGVNGILHKINDTTIDSSPRLSLQCFMQFEEP